VALGDILYVIGGHSRKSTVNSVEQYDIRANKWVPVASMNTKRALFGCAIVGTSIFVCGGATAVEPALMSLSSVEIYNVLEDKWEFSCEMSEEKSYCQLISV